MGCKSQSSVLSLYVSRQTVQQAYFIYQDYRTHIWTMKFMYATDGAYFSSVDHQQGMGHMVA